MVCFFINGGVDDAKFELFEKYIFDLFTPETHKIKKVTGSILTGDLTTSSYTLLINESQSLLKKFFIPNILA